MKFRRIIYRTPLHRPALAAHAAYWHTRYRLSRPAADDERPRFFGVGLFRTGTHSLARIVQPGMRAAHEPHRYLFARQWLRYHQARMSKNAWEAFLLRRDRALGLDFEASGFLCVEAPCLARLFPEAKFILTIREPIAWMRSLLREILINRQRLGYHYYDPLFRAWFGRDDFPEEEQELERQGLYPISGMLDLWKSANEKVLAHIPSNRILVIDTARINESLPAIAAFCGLRQQELKAANTHTHLNKTQLDPLVSIPENYLRDHAEKIAGKCWRIFADVAAKNVLNDRKDLETSSTTKS